MNVISKLPTTYILAVILWVLLIIEIFFKRKKTWTLPAVLVYGTIGMWYFTEIIYIPENYLSFPIDIVENAFIQVIIFLVTYRLLSPFFVKKLTPKTFNTLPQFNLIGIKSQHLLYILSSVWLLILLIGLSQVKWDIMSALLPIGGRANATYLFQRGAIGNSTGFIISSMGYIYNLICSFFGILLFFQRKNSAKFLNFTLIIISWPMFIFSGTRSTFLATVVPSFLTYLIVSKQKLWVKVLITYLCFTFMNYLLSVIITFRNVGYEDYISQVLQTGDLRLPNENQKHEGLNMAEELFYINSYLRQGLISINYGYAYFIEALNWVPRPLWPDKPFIGLDYALLRAPLKGGFAGVGITATVSRGLIGGGVLSFGPILGPIAPAVLMAVWSGIIARFWQQRYSILRFALFLVALGMTPNLGRDFTLLVLWPIIFGYFIILYIERIEQRRLRVLQSSYKI